MLVCLHQAIREEFFIDRRSLVARHPLSLCSPLFPRDHQVESFAALVQFHYKIWNKLLSIWCRAQGGVIIGRVIMCRYPKTLIPLSSSLIASELQFMFNCGQIIWNKSHMVSEYLRWAKTKTGCINWGWENSWHASISLSV